MAKRTEKMGAGMTEKRANAIAEWARINCRTCANNDDAGTDFVNCQAEHEVLKDVGIACVHYEEYIGESE